MMPLPGIRSLQRVVRRASRSLVPRVLILLYHRVASSSPDPQLLCVTPTHFGEHLEVLRKYGTPIALRKLVPALENRQLPRRAVVVTFDDGYADNLHQAKPLLERHDVPATVFVSSGYVGSEKEFWYDDLERLLLQPGILPNTLQLDLDGELRQWQVNGAVHYDEQNSCCHADWNVSREDNPTLRHQLYRSLFQTLRPLPDKQRRQLVDDLLVNAGVRTSGRPSHRILSPEETIQLAEGGLVEVGSHTVSHPVLSTISSAAQAAEISQSKACLERILGDRITSFAYPYGGPADYTDETVAAVRQAGFECACAAFPGMIGRTTERWQLPRFVVRDWDGQELERRLSQWFRS